MTDRTCPCGNGLYAECCEPLHDGVRQADTALELMRARYSAMALGLENFLFRTWHPRMRPESLSVARVPWTDLHILETIKGGPDDHEGVVEFVASYTVDGQTRLLRENAGFLRHSGRWAYVAPVSDA